MSLVDYDASSSEDEAPELNQTKQPLTQSQSAATAQIKDSSLPQSQRRGSSSKKCPDSSVHSSEPVMEKLPDVSLLLNSSSTSPHLSHTSAHSARVAAAMAENASRKRDAALASASLRSKIPRGTLPHTRNIPDTEGGMLIPPQVRGRSNVATEDIGKLFVQKHPDTLPHRNSDYAEDSPC